VLPILSLAICNEASPNEPALRWITRETQFVDAWPCFSPDGRTILFSRAENANGPYRLFVVDLSGGSPRPFLSAAPFPSATRASWSLRHNRVALTGGEVGHDTGAIWIVDPDGNNFQRVPSGNVSANVQYPSWDAAGDSVVVVDFGESGGSRLKRLTLRSGTTEALTDPREFLVGMPTVSPDGALVAFAGQRASGGAYDQMANHIWILTKESATYEVSQGQGRHPSWSPDGQWLAFTSTRADKAGRQAAVFIVPRSGGPPRQLTPHSVEAAHPVWSPDGQSLVFSARVPGAGRSSSLALLRVPPHQ
jgi:Tol biopolymer transport system component